MAMGYTRLSPKQRIIKSQPRFFEAVVINKKIIFLTQFPQNDLYLKKKLKIMQPAISNPTSNHIHRLFVDSPHCTEIVIIDTISYFESNLGLTIIHLINGKKYTIFKSLDSILKKLHDPRFIQISRNIIINKSFAEKITTQPTTKNVYIEMSQPIDIKLKCTRYNLKQLKDILQY